MPLVASVTHVVAASPLGYGGIVTVVACALLLLLRLLLRERGIVAGDRGDTGTVWTGRWWWQAPLGNV